jgi:hypothetical protein
VRKPFRSRYGTSLYGAWVCEAEPQRCSARDCRAAATIELSWRNPKLHDAARVKTWLACDDHADSLAEFLSRRNFLLGRRPLDGSS